MDLLRGSRLLQRNSGHPDIRISHISFCGVSLKKVCTTIIKRLKTDTNTCNSTDSIMTETRKRVRRNMVKTSAALTTKENTWNTYLLNIEKAMFKKFKLNSF